MKEGFSSKQSWKRKNHNKRLPIYQIQTVFAVQHQHRSPAENSNTFYQNNTQETHSDRYHYHLACRMYNRKRQSIIILHAICTIERDDPHMFLV